MCVCVCVCVCVSVCVQMGANVKDKWMDDGLPPDRKSTTDYTDQNLVSQSEQSLSHASEIAGRPDDHASIY